VTGFVRSIRRGAGTSPDRPAAGDGATIGPVQDLLTWVGLTVLAVILAIVGPMKLQYRTYVDRRGSAWARDAGPARTRLIGVLEIVLAMAMVWPLATRTVPWLSVAACLGAAMVLFGACWLHLRRIEYELAGATGLLGILAVAVAAGIAF
jgi:hypothetical protein